MSSLYELVIYDEKYLIFYVECKRAWQLVTYIYLFWAWNYDLQSTVA